jgi:uncharacterized membrane protein
VSHQESMDYLRAAEHWFQKPDERFGAAERRVLSKAARRLAMAEDPNHQFDSEATFGDRLADRVARFGGSWTFIVAFFVFLACWAILNSVNKAHAVDPYPFVFLNLILSMLAAIQAPIIMMSQNRQAYKDRRMASHDYEVNLKAEIEILALHEKVDALRAHQLQDLIIKQQQQLELLQQLAARLEAQSAKQ